MIGLITHPAPAARSNPLHVAFLALVPQIEAHARRRFRAIPCPDRRADLVAEAVALAWRWFLRLHQRGKDVAQFPATFGALAARAAASGRRLGGQEPAGDVLSPLARRRGVVVRSLSADAGGGVGLAAWLRDNTRSPVPDQVAFRLDWPAYLETLPDRDRQLAAYLALGHSGIEAAAAFGITPARVTQLRKRWRRGWRRSQAADSLIPSSH